MRRFPSVALSASLALAACSSGPVTKQPGPKPSPTPTASSQTRPPPDCPEEMLSCGKQKPVISNGVEPFDNENYEIRAYVPRGDRVCLSRSGEAPHGFYAAYETARPCEEPNP